MVGDQSHGIAFATSRSSSEPFIEESVQEVVLG